MARKVFGLDPSLTSTGLSDGTNHILIKTLPGDILSPLGDTTERIARIMYAIAQFVGTDPNFIIYVEAPMLNSEQANHLYEVGQYNHALYLMFGEDHLRWVTPGTLKQFISLKGNASKKHHPDKCGVGKMPLCVTCGARVYHGMVFEKDPGQDKIHAWALYAMGSKIEAGELEYTPIARRGKGGKKKKCTTKSSNTVTMKGKRKARSSTAKNTSVL